MRKTTKWPELIKYADGKLLQAKRRVAQLEALIATFRADYKAGKECPADVAEEVARSHETTMSRTSEAYTDAR